MTESANHVGVWRKQSLHANVIRSCQKCGAPGYWHNTPGVNVGCYAPEKVTKLGEDPVGLICPNCGTKRPSSIEEHGEIWSKLFGSRAALMLARITQTMRSVFNGRKVQGSRR